MAFWAALVALTSGALLYAGDLSPTLVSLAEIGGVIALFTLICAAEVFSIPNKPTLDDNGAQPEA